MNYDSVPNHGCLRARALSLDDLGEEGGEYPAMEAERGTTLPTYTSDRNIEGLFYLLVVRFKEPILKEF